MDYVKLLAFLRYFVRTDNIESKANFCRVIRNRVEGGMDGERLEDTLVFLLESREALWAFDVKCDYCTADELCRDCKELLIAWEASEEPIHTATHFVFSSRARARESFMPHVAARWNKTYRNKAKYTKRVKELFARAEALTAKANSIEDSTDA